jgi:hypothetical protein
MTWKLRLACPSDICNYCQNYAWKCIAILSFARTRSSLSTATGAAMMDSQPVPCPYSAHASRSGPNAPSITTGKMSGGSKTRVDTSMPYTSYSGLDSAIQAGLNKSRCLRRLWANRCSNSPIRMAVSISESDRATTLISPNTSPCTGVTKDSHGVASSAVSFAISVARRSSNNLTWCYRLTGSYTATSTAPP